jgi:hypothetical protein
MARAGRNARANSNDFIALIVASQAFNIMVKNESSQHFAVSTLADAQPGILTGDQLLATEAMHLLMRIDGDIRDARAQWNQDWFRRLMRIRPKAVSRLRRRWAKLDPPPAIPLGTLKRRYHANLSRYLYHLPDAEGLISL